MNTKVIMQVVYLVIGFGALFIGAASIHKGLPLIILGIMCIAIFGASLEDEEKKS